MHRIESIDEAAAFLSEHKPYGHGRDPVALRVYRVEDPETRSGLYRSSNYANVTLTDLDERHPMPTEDAALKNYWCALNYLGQSAHCFGFASLEQLKSWIYSDEARSAIDAEGCKISVFDAIGFAGDTQCVFLRDSRGPNLETLSLTEI